MLKFIFLTFLTLFFIGCSSDIQEEPSLSENQTKYLSISKAPIGYEIPIFQKLTLEFNAELNTGSITDSSVYIEDANGTHVGLYLGISTDVNLTKIIFTPFQYLSPSSTYTIFVTTDVKSIGGLSLAQDYNSSFITASSVLDDSNLSLVGFKPDLNLSAEPLMDISLEFSKYISDAPLYDGSTVLELKDSSGVVLNGEVSFFNSIVSFSPTVALDLNETYTITLISDITDMYGNIYGGARSWEFKTNIYTALVQNKGFKSLHKYPMNEPASIVRTVLTSDFKNLVCVAAQGKMIFYGLDVSFNGYPSLFYSYEVLIPSQINTVEICDDRYMMVGTMNDGVYILEVNATSARELAHLPTTNHEAVYGVTCGKDTNQSTDKLYAVGPNLGMDIYNLEGNDTISFVNNIAIDGAPLKVVTALNQSSRRVYVSDYNFGVRVFDENGTSILNTELNGSTKNVVVVGNKDYPTGVLAINSIGRSISLYLDGNVSQYEASIDLLSSITDIDIRRDDYTSYAYMVNENKGVMVLESSYGIYKNGLIKTDGNVVSASSIIDANLSFIATLDDDGVVNIFNSTLDVYEPYPSIYLGADGNITVLFNEFVDPLTANNTSFLIEEINATNNTTTTIPFTLAPSADAKIFILNADINIFANDYNVTVKRTVSDQVGNEINGGEDVKVTISANDQV